MNYSGGILTTGIQPSPDIQEVAFHGIIGLASSSFQRDLFLCKSPLFQSCHKAFQDGSGGHLTTLCVLRGLRTQLSLAFRQTAHKSSWQRFSFQAFFATIIISSQRLPERRNIWKQRVWRYFLWGSWQTENKDTIPVLYKLSRLFKPFRRRLKRQQFHCSLDSRPQKSNLVSIERGCLCRTNKPLAKAQK